MYNFRELLKEKTIILHVSMFSTHYKTEYFRLHYGMLNIMFLAVIHEILMHEWTAVCKIKHCGTLSNFISN